MFALLATRPQEEFNPADDDDIEYEVEGIMSHRQQGRRRGGRMLYRVKWKGYTETTDEPEEHLMNALDLLNEYQLNRSEARGLFRRGSRPPA